MNSMQAVYIYNTYLIIKCSYKVNLRYLHFMNLRHRYIGDKNKMYINTWLLFKVAFLCCHFSLQQLSNTVLKIARFGTHLPVF